MTKSTISSKYLKRDDSVAIAKAIGIILVVIGHCSIREEPNGLLSCLHDFIYLFHMPLFFFLSGRFFRWDILANKKKFVGRKVKGLWIPFVKWMLLFLLLHNYLLDIGMLSPYNGISPVRYDLCQIGKSVYNILLLNWNEQLLGGFWFIPALFFASIYSMLALYCVNYIKPKFLMEEGVLLVVIFLFILASSLLVHIHKGLPLLGIRDRVFLASAVFLSVFYANSIESKLKFNPLVLLFSSLLFLIVCSRIHSVEVIKMRIWYDVPYLWLTGVVGSISVITISRMIVKFKWERVNNGLIYIGENTMIILALHFTCFKLINLLKVYYYGMDERLYGSFPVLYSDPSRNGVVWLLLYILIGVLIPIIIKKVSDLFFMEFHKITNKN